MFLVNAILGAGLHSIVEFVLGIFGMRKPDTVEVKRNEKVVNDPDAATTYADLGL